MHATIATLQTAARTLQLAGDLDQSKYGRLTAQLRELAEIRLYPLFTLA